MHNRSFWYPQHFNGELNSLERLRVRAKVQRRITSSLSRIIVDYYSTKLRELMLPRCPRCQARLATAKAQQCLRCGLDWHGKPRPADHEKPGARGDCWSSNDDDTTVLDAIELSMTSAWEQAHFVVLQSRWSESKAWRDALVTPKDVLVVKDLIESMPSIDHRIIEIRRIADNALEITTGFQAGPLCGRGSYIVVRSIRDHWTIVRVSGWVS